MYSIWHEMFKIASVSGAPPGPRWGSLRRSPRPPSRNGLLAFGTRSFASSALALSQTRTYSLVYLRNFRLWYFPQLRSACDAIDHAQGLSPPKRKILVTSLYIHVYIYMYIYTCVYIIVMFLCACMVAPDSDCQPWTMSRYRTTYTRVYAVRSSILPSVSCLDRLHIDFKSRLFIKGWWRSREKLTLICWFSMQSTIV